MRVSKIENDRELQRILWACYKYWQIQSSSAERAICYNWVLRPYEERFGAKFHQSRLRRLKALGFLEQEEISRAGHRRYYRIVDSDRVRALLRKWDLLQE